MSWRPIDFLGIIELDRKIVDQLEQFLQEKRNRLIVRLLKVIPLPSQAVSIDLVEPASTQSSSSFSLESQSALISNPPSFEQAKGKTRLTDELDSFSKRVRLSIKRDADSPQMSVQANRTLKDVNSALWEFTEVLEGCVVELFQQVRQVPIHRWHYSIASVVHDIKEILIHYIEDLLWIIQRLEKPLKEYCQTFHVKPKQTWRDWLSFRSSYLDPQLSNNLYKTEEYLKTEYEVFDQSYKEYISLNEKTEEAIGKIRRYPILALLSVSEQQFYVNVYRLIKMMELNRKSKRDIGFDTAKALQHLSSVENIIAIFQSYYNDLKEAFFRSSLEWKSLDREEEYYPESFDRLKYKIKEYQEELNELSQTMRKYRAFILKNDPNPYVRSRWGFTERIVAPEPEKAKKLMNLIFSAEILDQYFAHFIFAMEKDPRVQEANEDRAREEIEAILHEMGQPLISRSMMRHRAERFLEELKACDEIGSPNLSTIYFVEDALSRVMREDWRYHVLHEFPLFKQIYTLHQGLVGSVEDPSHAYRIERFNELFKEIEKWVDNKAIYSHLQEIEHDINDMKTYLQDFLASVQRIARDKSQNPFLDETLVKLGRKLLEYRYLFGRFFLHIMTKNNDGAQLRNHFLFVDQYFETVENLLNQLRGA